MLRAQVSQGDRVELAIDGPDGRIDLAAIVARVAPNRIVFALPKLDALPEGIEPGCRVSVRLPAFAGSSWSHTVAHAVSPGPPPTIEVERLTGQRVQRRGFHRVDVCLRVTWLVLPPGDQTPLGPPSTGVTDNLSAGGLHVLTSAAPALKDRLRVRVELPGVIKSPAGDAIEAEARVRRIVEVPRRSPPRYNLALQLLFAHESERETWQRLIAELQRSMPR